MQACLYQKISSTNEALLIILIFVAYEIRFVFFCFCLKKKKKKKKKKPTQCPGMALMNKLLITDCPKSLNYWDVVNLII